MTNTELAIQKMYSDLTELEKKIYEEYGENASDMVSKLCVRFKKLTLSMDKKIAEKGQIIDFSYGEDFWILTSHYVEGVSDVRTFKDSQKQALKDFVNTIVFQNEDCINFHLCKVSY